VVNTDTVYTDTNGKFTMKTIYPEFPLKIQDIDGEENGGDFAIQELEVKFIEEDKFVKTQTIALEKRRLEAPMYGVPPAFLDK
jgi:hypothetical protein